MFKFLEEVLQLMLFPFFMAVALFVVGINFIIDKTRSHAKSV